MRNMRQTTQLIPSACPRTGSPPASLRPSTAVGSAVGDLNPTYLPNLPGRRPQRDVQPVEEMVAVICVLKVERYEVRLLVATRVVVVALVERDVTDSVPAISGAIPGGSAR